MTANEILNDSNFGHLNYKISTSKNIIKVIGVGGGGGNAVTNMYNDGVADVTFVLCNTDDQALQRSPISNQILLGKDITGGWGAGNNPEKAREAAISSLPEIEAMIRDNPEEETNSNGELKVFTRMAFITAGMGGGTGTGAAPVIAETCHRLGVLTVGIVTIPFGFEPQKKMRQALDGIVKMSPFLDALLVIRNDRIPEIFPNEGLAKFTKSADNVLAKAAKSIVEIITKSGYINVDFADVYTTLKNGGRTVMNTGIGDGENRVCAAINDALTSPLLFDFNIQKTKKVLMVIYTSSTNEITGAETNEIKNFMNTLDPEIDFIWGAFYDDDLTDEVKITLIATGADVSVLPEEILKMEEFMRLEKNSTENHHSEQEDLEANTHGVTIQSLDDENVLNLIQQTPAYLRVEEGV